VSNLVVFKLIGFVLASAGIVWVSWRPLRAPRSHGFPRFFAWEAIAALVLLNIEHWFRRPFSPPQLVSWVLLLASVAVLVAGLRMLKVVGAPRADGSAERGAQPEANYAFENTTHLVEVGIYRYIRHPLYASLLLLAWGTVLKDLSVGSVLLVAVTTAALFATAILEERENVETFGGEYADYMRRTRRFIPYAF
jgi:protein-S-isoprenylcysteine O-methyltransferase Ste14